MTLVASLLLCVVCCVVCCIVCVVVVGFGVFVVLCVFGVWCGGSAFRCVARLAGVCWCVLPAECCMSPVDYPLCRCCLCACVCVYCSIVCVCDGLFVGVLVC